MAHLYPKMESLGRGGPVVAPAAPTMTTTKMTTTRLRARPELFGAWSVVDDAKAKAKAKTGGIELYSDMYYAACTAGGVLACGPTHTAVTPLDLVKTRRQVDSRLYTGNFQAWGKIYRGEGVRGIFTGWSPTLLGYSAQGGFKYGWYEYFKKTYSEMAGLEAAAKYKTGLYLAASASAEFLADMALCPLEAVKDYFKIFMGLPTTGGPPPAAEKK